jgi:hypothetical protein
VKTNRRSFLKGLGALVPAAVAARALPTEAQPMRPIQVDPEPEDDEAWLDEPEVPHSWEQRNGDTPSLRNGVLTIDTADLWEHSLSMDVETHLDEPVNRPLIHKGPMRATLTLRTSHDGLRVMLDAWLRNGQALEVVLLEDERMVEFPSRTRMHGAHIENFSTIVPGLNASVLYEATIVAYDVTVETQ